jgi:hypothetical protein
MVENWREGGIKVDGGEGETSRMKKRSVMVVRLRKRSGR